MNNNDRKVIKFNRDVKFNAASCVVAAILLYIIICVIISARKEPVTTYKVNKTSVSNNITLEGVILREEKLINTSSSGYVCFYIRDGERVKKNSTICTMDESGEIYDKVSDNEAYDGLLTEDDYNDIRSLISLYKVSYDNSEFYSAYTFYNNVNNKVLELTNELIMQQIQTNNSSSYKAISTPYSGIITYYIDGYEDKTPSTLTQSDFDKSSYNKQTLKTGDIIKAATPIVKIIPNEEWNIIAPISAEEIALISESTYVEFRVNNSDYSMYMPYEILNNSDGTYINIKMDKYMSNFIAERHIDVEILIEENTGLKIPNTAIVEKEVYKIPISYFTGGSNQNYANMLNIQVMGEDGDITIKQVQPTIYKSDDDFKYVDPAAFSDTDVLFNITTNETYAVSNLPRENIKGVYCVNRGIAEFFMVDVVKVVDDFTLIRSDGTLKIYDNIVLDAESVKENEIIY